MELKFILNIVLIINIKINNPNVIWICIEPIFS